MNKMWHFMAVISFFTSPLLSMEVVVPEESHPASESSVPFSVKWDRKAPWELSGEKRRTPKTKQRTAEQPAEQGEQDLVSAQIQALDADKTRNELFAAMQKKEEALVAQSYKDTEQITLLKVLLTNEKNLTEEAQRASAAADAARITAEKQRQEIERQAQVEKEEMQKEISATRAMLDQAHKLCEDGTTEKPPQL